MNTGSAGKPAAPAIFYGWIIVFAAHLLFALIFGAAYSFGAFFAALQANFDSGHFSTASIFSLTALIYYLVGVFSGALTDRTSTRTVVISGILLLALGFFLSSFATQSLTLFLACFCSLVGLGVGLVYIPTVTAVQRWFVRKRGRASGIAIAGTGVGTFIGPTAAGLLMQHLSWQSTMQIFAGAIAVIGTGAALLLYGTPQERGLLPDGDTSRHANAPQSGMRLADAVRLARFWWYFISIFLGSVSLFLALVHISPYAQQQGIPATQANFLIGLIGIGNGAGRLALGSLGDRFGARRLLLVLTFGLAVVSLIWLNAGSFERLALFALLFGALNGGCISLFPAVAVSWFGTANLGAILGALYVSVGIAALIGGSVGGLLFDLTQSYSASIALGGLCALVSALCLVAAGRARSAQAF